MKWKFRIMVLALGAFVLAQGVGNYRAHHWAYWNASYKFIFYPETQMTCGVLVMLLAILPLKRIVDHFTAPYLDENRQPNLKPFWKRRHQHLDDPE